MLSAICMEFVTQWRTKQKKNNHEKSHTWNRICNIPNLKLIIRTSDKSCLKLLVVLETWFNWLTVQLRALSLALIPSPSVPHSARGVGSVRISNDRLSATSLVTVLQRQFPTYSPARLFSIRTWSKDIIKLIFVSLICQLMGFKASPD